MPKYLGQERIAGASKVPLFSSTGQHWKVNNGNALLKSQHTVVKNAVPTLSFLPHVFL